jgi:anthranilate/para-aminobenzoate synthase component II
MLARRTALRPDRDATTLPLIRAAVARGVPLLAICRGIQEMNVALGGTLLTEVQELEGRIDHRAPVSDDQDERFAIHQTISIKPDSCLAGIFGAGEIKANSVHRQAVGKVGANLVVEAVAEDGTVEAVSVKNSKAFAVGVQWHPEYWAKTDEASGQIFKAFGDAARAHRAERLGFAGSCRIASVSCLSVCLMQRSQRRTLAKGFVTFAIGRCEFDQRTSSSPNQADRTIGIVAPAVCACQQRQLGAAIWIKRDTRHAVGAGRVAVDRTLGFTADQSKSLRRDARRQGRRQIGRRRLDAGESRQTDGDSTYQQQPAHDRKHPRVAALRA